MLFSPPLTAVQFPLTVAKAKREAVTEAYYMDLFNRFIIIAKICWPQQ